MSIDIQIFVNQKSIRVPDGISVAAAIARAGAPFRRALDGQRRAPLCGMGVCFECRARVDGRDQQCTCMLPVHEGMRVETDD